MELKCQARKKTHISQHTTIHPDTRRHPSKPSGGSFSYLHEFVLMEVNVLEDPP